MIYHVYVAYLTPSGRGREFEHITERDDLESAIESAKHEMKSHSRRRLGSILGISYRVGAQSGHRTPAEVWP